MTLLIIGLVHTGQSFITKTQKLFTLFCKLHSEGPIKKVLQPPPPPIGYEYTLYKTEFQSSVNKKAKYLVKMMLPRFKECFQ